MRYVIFNLVVMLTYSCSAQNALCDKSATAETVVLYNNLVKLTQKGIMFGHQDDLAYGVNWKYEKDRSDVKDAIGDYPAVYGWDLGGLEKDSDKNIDGIPFSDMRRFIQEGKIRGGIITMSWHMDNPFTGKNAWDTTPNSLASVLPGGSKHDVFKVWLDKAAVYLNSLTDDQGKKIPMLFRPYHELTGTWFWWCKNNGTPDQFKALWKFTMSYLQSKNVHQLIYVYNTSDFKDKADFLEYYPGDDAADMLSFDCYQMKSSAEDPFVKNTLRQLHDMDEIALQKKKPIAIAETGFEAIPEPKWWTQTLLKAIGDYKLSYVLVWRNHGWNEYMDPPRMHYYAPFKGQVSQQDFIDFYKTGHILFEKDVAKQKLYGN
ncbi:glycoside hydrolase family 26 protein [Flavobacterium silvaticum]|uniref:Mannan endo-1,4-beta-mannosidase n=1 Tax=Flavobacterium silvaticum TaxID=1852020 RepID=A0A972FRZ5_9FLAO|nr:glycosyl hydrolase [Flavobacterium silvaticum]NMH27413.1 beta-mannosidase [Flavobacterium silvaticum]